MINKGKKNNFDVDKRLASMSDLGALIIVVVLFLILKPVVKAILRGMGSSSYRRDR